MGLSNVSLLVIGSADETIGGYLQKLLPVLGVCTASFPWKSKELCLCQLACDFCM